MIKKLIISGMIVGSIMALTVSQALAPKGKLRK